MAISQIIQLVPGSCWSPTGRPVAKPVANQVSCDLCQAVKLTKYNHAGQMSWPGTMKFGVVSAMCAALCASREVGGMFRMSLFRLWERESWNPWLSTILWRDLRSVSLGQSCHILLMCFFFWRPNTFCNSTTKSHIPFLLLFDLHISPDTPTKIPTFFHPSTPLTRWLSNGCHQICLTLHRGWIRKSWSWSRTRRSTPPPKLRWRLPWNLIYKLRNNSLFLV